MNDSSLESFVPTVLHLCDGDPARIRKLMNLAMIEAIARKSEASEPATLPPTADFPYSQADAARIVCGRLGLDVQTFRKYQPWRLLEKKHLGEGVGFSKPRPTRNGGETRDYSQNAVDFLMKPGNWDMTRWEIVRLRSRRSIRPRPAP